MPTYFGAQIFPDNDCLQALANFCKVAGRGMALRGVQLGDGTQPVIAPVVAKTVAAGSRASECRVGRSEWLAEVHHSPSSLPT